MKVLLLMTAIMLMGCEGHPEASFHQKPIPGIDGESGVDGSDGALGTQGPQGIPGIQGSTGKQGVAGTDGKDGSDCSIIRTSSGAIITCGKTSSKIADGTQGPQGFPGATGNTGAQGPKGDRGQTGYTGATGAQGIQGLPGNDGKDGKDGTYSSIKIYEAYRSKNHVLWFPGHFGEDRLYRFEEGMSGLFTEYPNGTARLTGVVRGVSDPQYGFHVDIQFRKRTGTAPAGSPKYGANTGADASSWHYYETTTGIITGTGRLVGLKLKLDRKGPAFQVGVGANYHDMDFGASGWLYYTVLENAKCVDYRIYEADPSHQYGDINLDLIEIQ